MRWMMAAAMVVAVGCAGNAIDLPPACNVGFALNADGDCVVCGAENQLCCNDTSGTSASTNVKRCANNLLCGSSGTCK